MTALPWLANDELFFEQLRLGKAWEYVVARQLRDVGHDVIGPAAIEFQYPLEVRRDRWYKTVDLIVDGRPIEVKSRSLNFTSPADYPYGDMYVSQVEVMMPPDTILVSQYTGAMIVVPEWTHPQWSKLMVFDTKRQIQVPTWAAPLFCGFTIDYLMSPAT